MENEEDVTVPLLMQQVSNLSAENKRLKKALSEQIDRDISGIFPAERALAERAGGVKAGHLSAIEEWRTWATEWAGSAWIADEALPLDAPPSPAAQL